MKSLQTSIIILSLCLIPTLPATAQVISFDPTNLAAQIKNLAQFRAQLQQLTKQTQLARDVRDAARRVQQEHRSLTRVIDRATRIAEAQAGVVTQLNDALQQGHTISYHMDAQEWSDTFAMGRPTDDPDYDIRMNERSMETVTATMSTLQVHEDEIRRLTHQLDILGAQLAQTDRLEERQTIQTSITLLEAQREVQQTQLDLARANIKGILQAVQLDAAANATLQYRRDREAVQEYAKYLKEQN